MANRMEFRLIEHGSAEYDQSVELRDRILRKPLGLQFLPEQLAAEHGSCHVAGFLDGIIRACCIVVAGDERKFQVRQVAVDDGLQRQGYGEQLMQFAEAQIERLGGDTVFCHSREVAQSFYEKLGYTTIGDPFVEVGITHILMEKRLGPAN